MTVFLAPGAIPWFYQSQRTIISLFHLKKSELFTTRMLADKAGINAELARQTLYVMTKMGMVERCGKQRNAWIYERKLTRIKPAY
jgi:DNA-binding transcriptional regulator YhcF (GntR family)